MKASERVPPHDCSALVKAIQEGSEREIERAVVTIARTIKSTTTRRTAAPRRNPHPMNTARIRAGAGTVEITHRQVTYLAAADGSFTVPSEVAGELTNMHVAVIAPDAEPVAEPAPSNVFTVGTEAVTLDLDTIEARTLLLEL